MSESIRARRSRQKISPATQQWLMDRAEEKRQRKAKKQSRDAAYTRHGQRIARAMLREGASRIARRETRSRKSA